MGDGGVALAAVDRSLGPATGLSDLRRATGLSPSAALCRHWRIRHDSYRDRHQAEGEPHLGNLAGMLRPDDELRARGFRVMPGNLGENVTTRGIDLLRVPAGTRLALGHVALVQATALRNPCVQLDRFQSGLMAALLDRDDGGRLIRNAGVMAVVLTSGAVRPGDLISVELPPRPHTRLEPV